MTSRSARIEAAARALMVVVEESGAVDGLHSTVSALRSALSEPAEPTPAPKGYERLAAYRAGVKAACLAFDNLDEFRSTIIDRLVEEVGEPTPEPSTAPSLCGHRNCGCDDWTAPAPAEREEP